LLKNSAVPLYTSTDVGPGEFWINCTRAVWAADEATVNKVRNRKGMNVLIEMVVSAG